MEHSKEYHTYTQQDKRKRKHHSVHHLVIILLINLVPVEATRIREDQASLLTDDDPAVKDDITTGSKTVSIL